MTKTGKKDEELSLKKVANPTKANTCCTIIVNVVMLAFFGIYTFNNPDDSDCYASGDLASTIDFKGSKNVGKEFQIVFLTGFILCFINLAYAAVAVCFFMYAAKCMLSLASCLVACSGALTLAWMVYASIVIFSEEGQACSEDGFLPKSGQFIKVWLIIVYVCVGLICCCVCMFGCIITNNKKRQKRTK